MNQLIRIYQGSKSWAGQNGVLSLFTIHGNTQWFLCQVKEKPILFQVPVWWEKADSKSRILIHCTFLVPNNIILYRIVEFSNHRFKWWFAISPVRAEYMRRLKAGAACHSCFFRLKGPIGFLLFVHGFFGLAPDAFFHSFFVHVSDSRYTVPSGPKASVPFTPRVWMLIEDHLHCFFPLAMTTFMDSISIFCHTFSIT